MRLLSVRPLVYGLYALGFLAVPVLLAACDGGISGTPDGNQLPETELAVQVADLRDVLPEDTLAVPGDTLIMGEDTTIVTEPITDVQRFTSLVEVNWSGTDPDGFVEAYEIRFYDERDTIGPEAGWARTTSRDSLVLLPIPEGSPTANVVFEVRAIDNDGAVDPTPARTVFPVRNTPPELSISRSQVPPDTTWPAASFAFTASDLDGDGNIRAIEIALNDSTSFVELPAETDFVTLVATDPEAEETDTRLFLGRDGAPSELVVPGLMTDAVNTLYVRAVDAAGFASAVATYPDPDPEVGETWFVQRVTSPTLLVNDYRKSRNYLVLPYHRTILDGFVGEGNYDEWYLVEPVQEGSSVVLEYSDNIPTNPSPVLRETLQFWDYIYWVSNNATNRSVGNNLSLVAGFLDRFFENDGRLFVNVPIELPSLPEDNLGNNALSVLPLAGLLDFGPGSEYEEFQQDMELSPGAALTPSSVPGVGSLPALETTRSISLFSYPVGSGNQTLYAGELTAELENGEETDWPGPSTLASLRDDGQVALFAVPLVREINGGPYLEGADGDEDAPIEAIRVILDALGFPQQ